jgi:hypothetical protein
LLASEWCGYVKRPMVNALCDLALSALDREAVRDEALMKWLDNNTTYFDVKPPAVDAPNVPVLAAVSKRIWYHATDDQLSYPFSDVVRTALKREPNAEAK